MPENVPAHPSIVGDSGPLIALALIGQLELLRHLYDRVIVPQAVWKEVTVNGAGLPGAAEVGRLNWVEVLSANSPHLQTLSILVDRGEAEAIALALSIPGSTVLMDDSRGRRVAERFNVARIGTLGILRRARRAGQILAIKPFIEQLQASGIYLSGSLIDAVLRDAGEL